MKTTHQEFLRLEGIAIDYSPSASHKSTGMIEVINRVLESVVRKLRKKWDRSLIDVGSAVNSRMIFYLNISPREIIFGPLPEASTVITNATLKTLPDKDLRTWAEQLQDFHGKKILTYLRHRAEVHNVVRATSLR